LYLTKAEKALVEVLKEDPEVIAGGTLTALRLRKIAKRLTVELWMRGLALQARNVGSRPPSDAPDHKAWRDATIERQKAPRERRKRDPQTDVEASPS
jgi:hypothetical protein